MSILGSPLIIPSGGSPTPSPRLPAEYQEVEYIQTDGTAYIDTGYAFSGDAQFEFEMMYGGVGGHLFGASNSNGGIRFLVSVETNTAYEFYGTNTAGTSFASYPVPFGRNITNEMICTKGVMRPNYFVCLQDDMRYGGYATAQVGSYSLTDTAYILAQHYKGGKRGESGNRFKLFFIADWSGSEYVDTRNMISCYRKSSGVIGMYDLAQSGAGNDPLDSNFFINAAASGSFTKGADV